jgi:parallel beta-helix repeat protein
MIANLSTLQEKSPSVHKDMAWTRVIHVFGILVLLASLLVINTQHARAGGALTVNMVNEGDDANPGDGFCAVTGGGCSLRAAIEEVNALPAVAGGVNVLFALPGSGVHVISITSGPLPTITNPINLDGTSQPSCTAPCIVLSGANLVGPNLNGLALATNGSTVKGFIVTSWSGHGIAVNGDQNIVQGNDIGFWPGNPSLLPNGDGIAIYGSNNLIGGGLAGQGNVISGNTWQGITIANGCCSANASNVIQGNYIGTDATGTSALANHYHGISAFNLANNTSITNNVISGNTGFGLDLYGATGSLVRGNKIGTNAAGTAAVPNGAGGISIEQGANTNTIGGAAAGQPNTVSYNHGVGIKVIGATSINNRLQRNSIFANTALGIDLGHPGVTPNDALDPDSGPNRLQNFAVLTAARSSGHLVMGTLNSVPNHSYTIEVFVSPAGSCDPSGYGEGKKFLGAKVVTTNAAGNASFSLTSSAAFSAGQVITATATDSTGSTSEFSRCRAAN